MVSRRELLTAGAITLVALGQRSILAQPDKLVIVFPTRADAKDLKQKAEALAQILSKDLGILVEAVISDETAAVEALRANRADVAFLSSRAALKADQLAGAKLYLAEVRPKYSGGYTYRSIMVVRQDSPLVPQKSTLATLAQLKGKKFAFTSRTSTSGYIFPVGALVKEGLVESPDRLEGFFSNVFYGDGYSSALQSVLRGQSDACAVSEYTLGAPYITAEEAKQLRILYAVSGVPAHGIAIDDDLPTPLRERLISALLKLNEGSSNQLFQSLYNATKLVKIDHGKHLQPAQEALLRAKLDP